MYFTPLARFCNRYTIQKLSYKLDSKAALGCSDLRFTSSVQFHILYSTMDRELSSPTFSGNINSSMRPLVMSFKFENFSENGES